MHVRLCLVHVRLGFGYAVYGNNRIVCWRAGENLRGRGQEEEEEADDSVLHAAELRPAMALSELFSDQTNTTSFCFNYTSCFYGYVSAK